HLVAGQNADEVHAHLARDVSQHFVPVLQFDAKHRVGQWLDHRSFDLDDVFLAHRTFNLLNPPPPTPPPAGAAPPAPPRRSPVPPGPTAPRGPDRDGRAPSGVWGSSF